MTSNLLAMSLEMTASTSALVFDQIIQENTADLKITENTASILSDGEIYAIRFSRDNTEHYYIYTRNLVYMVADRTIEHIDFIKTLLEQLESFHQQFIPSFDCELTHWIKICNTMTKDLHRLWNSASNVEEYVVLENHDIDVNEQLRAMFYIIDSDMNEIKTRFQYVKMPHFSCKF